MNVLASLTFYFAIFLAAESGYGQGALAIIPISSYTADKQAILKTSIQNLTEKTVKFEFVPDCDIDGELLAGAACDKFFKYVTDATVKSGGYEITSKERAAIGVSLISPIKSYALFRPLIRPLLATDTPVGQGISFEFNYRPGFLFLVKPSEDRLAIQDFSTRVSDTARIATFKFNIKNFKTPHIANISAKLISKSSKKLVRFARLAEEKIIDPRREILELEVEYGAPKDPQDSLCYELFVQEKFDGVPLNKSTNCNN
jgi:hypothetical protein